MTPAEMDQVDAEIDREIVEAVKFAEESPLPKPEDVGKDVYTDFDEEVRVR